VEYAIAGEVDPASPAGQKTPPLPVTSPLRASGDQEGMSKRVTELTDELNVAQKKLKSSQVTCCCCCCLLLFVVVVMN